MFGKRHLHVLWGILVVQRLAYVCVAASLLALACQKEHERPEATKLEEGKGLSEGVRFWDASVTDADVVGDGGNGRDAAASLSFIDSGADAGSQTRASVAGDSGAGSDAAVGAGRDAGLVWDSSDAASCRQGVASAVDDQCAQENCSDQLDNDADGLVDCLDEDCSQQCNAPCSQPPELRELWHYNMGAPSYVVGSNTGRASAVSSVCTESQGGEDMVYHFVASVDGVLSAKVQSDADLVVSIRSACSVALSSELGCSSAGAEARVSITAGQEYFIVVGGVNSQASGEFTLWVSEREVVCGDGYVDGDEQCDNGVSATPGCSPQCTLELSEVEPNNDALQASEYVSPFIGQILPAGDVDVVSLTTERASDTLVFKLLGVSEDACANARIDSLIEVTTADGQLLGRNDNSGEGLCSSLTLKTVPAGTYLVKITGQPGPAETFAYRLNVFDAVCGDSVIGYGEQCDDGNTLPGDGCGAWCQLE